MIVSGENSIDAGGDVGREEGVGGHEVADKNANTELDDEYEEYDEEEVEEEEIHDESTLPDLQIFSEHTKETLLEDDHEFFVYFYTPWCKICIETGHDLMNRVVENVYGAVDHKLDKNDLQNAVRFGMINCAESPSFCMRFGVRSFPSFVLYKNGKYAPYLGGRDVAEMTHFAKTKAEYALFKEIGPQQPFYMICLENIEAYVTTVRIVDDSDLNSALIGLIVGFAILLPIFVIFLCTYSILWGIDMVTGPPSLKKLKKKDE